MTKYWQDAIIYYSFDITKFRLLARNLIRSKNVKKTLFIQRVVIIIRVILIKFTSNLLFTYVFSAKENNFTPSKYPLVSPLFCFSVFKFMAFVSRGSG